MSKGGGSSRFVVDRREADYFVVVDENGASFDVRSSNLPPQCRHEGAVLDVPQNSNGDPTWQQAKRNRSEEERRLRDAKARLDRLRRTDPGGDVEL